MFDDDDDFSWNDETDELDNYDGFDEPDTEDSEAIKLSDFDVRDAATMDRESDCVQGMPTGCNYGTSIDLDELTDEQRNLYDLEYHSYHPAQDWDSEDGEW